MRAPINIHLETPNYVVRTLEETDDMGNWGDWLDDPNTARMMNVPRKKLTLEDFKNHVRGFDRINHHLLGIFRRSDGLLVGMFANYIDWDRSEFLINLIVGDIAERKTNIRHETSWRVNTYFFETLDLKFQRANALATNVPAIKVLEEKKYMLSARTKQAGADGGVVEVLHYTRSREDFQSLTPMSDAELLRRSSAA